MEPRHQGREHSRRVDSQQKEDVMSRSKGIKEVAYIDVRQGGGAHTHGRHGDMLPLSWTDCAGGGQVVVERGIAYIGNMQSPHGTLIYDVKDPKHPKLLAQ